MSDNHPKEDAQDQELWLQEIAQTAELKSRRRHNAVAPPAAQARMREADNAQVMHDALHGDYEPEDFQIGEQADFRQSGVSASMMKKLKRGHYSIQADLDLHGLDRHKAHQAILRFLTEAREHQWRCVKIIHGKGLRSPGGLPILKSRTEISLRHHEDVLAFCSAPQWAGGYGAVLVLLRKH